MKTKLSEFESLPREIQKRVFTFFSPKELINIASVNKNFRQLSQEEINRLKNQHKDNIFYTVGKPIHISNPKRTIFDMDAGTEYRKKIPNTEIYESFLGINIQTVRLFKTEHEALEYSRFLRTGDQLLEDTEVYQPAIFKVIYLRNLENIAEHNEAIVINQGRHSLASERNERIANITYFETHRSNVIPIEGVLKIHLYKIGEFKTHGPIDYSNLDFIEENKSSFSIKRSCAIS